MNSYAPALTSKMGRLTVSALALAFFGISIGVILTKGVGYAPADLFSVHDPANRALEVVFSEFPLFGANLCFHYSDVGTHQVEMMTKFLQLTSSTYAADHTIRPWLSCWYGFLYFGALGATGGNQSPLVPTREQLGLAIATYALTSPEYKLQKFMPFGPFNHNSPKVFRDLFNAHRRIPMPAEAFRYTSPPWIV
jgi:hypothetical protein